MVSHNRTELVQQACPHCVMVFGHDLDVTAGRYAALCQLIRTTQWQVQISGKYDYIYFPEEEIVQAVHAVNRWAHCLSCQTMVLGVSVDLGETRNDEQS